MLNNNSVIVTSVKELKMLARNDWANDETSWGFDKAPLFAVSACKIQDAWLEWRDLAMRHLRQLAFSKRQ